VSEAMTIAEVSKELRCSESMVRKLMKVAGLPYVPLGNRKIVRRGDLDAWIESRVEAKELV